MLEGVAGYRDEGVVTVFPTMTRSLEPEATRNQKTLEMRHLAYTDAAAPALLVPEQRVLSCSVTAWQETTKDHHK